SVADIATAAKARSAQFSSPNDTVAGGTLSLHVKGVAISIAIAPNSDISSVAKQINQTGGPVTAAVISDGSKFYLSLSNKDTGKPIGSGVNGGLIIDNDPTGLGLAVTQDALNAKLTVDGLPVESQSNQITTAIPGVTLNVVAKQPVASDLVVGADPSKSTAKLQGFVDAFNAIKTALQPSLKPDPNAPAPAGSTLDGVLAYGLESRLNSLLSSKVIPLGAHRTLADIGVKLQQDGTVTIDTALFNDAVAKDPTGVDAIFSTATTGISAQMAKLSTSYTDSIDGQLVQRQTSLKTTIKDLQKTNQRLQDHVTAYKAQLQAQFARMESLIANYNSIGSFLSSKEKASSSSK
ncbi:MAG TPA: flagellar filament capping protein FliD, partial [Polyangia bacterium]|nr:flagellar filament capping protein FliD [Polyangia bacterium]